MTVFNIDKQVITNDMSISDCHQMRPVGKQIIYCLIKQKEMKMISLETFSDLSTTPVGKFNPKPTTLTDGQTEALNIVWKSPNDATSIGV